MVPLLFSLIVFLPQRDHLALAIVAILACGVAATEIYDILSERIGRGTAQKLATPFIGMIMPAVALLEVQRILPDSASILILTFSAAVILAAQSFRRNEESFEQVLPNVSGNLLLLIYPGVFAAYVIRMGGLPYSEVLIVAFLAAVYFNDTAAYLAGMALGRFSPNPVAVSPNKSLIGFIGGFLTSPLVMWLASVLFPAAFPSGIWAILGLGAAVGVATILGDLAESALKRAVTAKDSGAIIPGRGGLLDSIDSVLLAAPVFFYLYTVLF